MKWDATEKERNWELRIKIKGRTKENWLVEKDPNKVIEQKSEVEIKPHFRR